MALKKEEKQKAKELFEQGLKKCSSCGLIKSVLEYPNDINNVFGLKSACRECSGRKRSNTLIRIEDEKLLKNNLKRCRECREIKDISNFHSDVTHWDGLRSKCRDCLGIKQNRIELLKQAKILLSQDLKKCSKCKEIKNTSSFKKDDRRWDNLGGHCKECRNESDKKYKKKNWRKIRDAENKREAEKRKKDPIFRLHKNIAQSVRGALKDAGLSKKGEPVFNLLRYTGADLKKHLESQFESWMNWNNLGVYRKAEWRDNDPSTWRWQIDHIVPQSKLKYDSLEHPNFQLCWALSNLRPYNAKKNVEEGDRRNIGIMESND